MPTIRKTRRYGWKPDLPDVRDFRLSIPFHKRLVLPKHIDLRVQMPPVYDQGDLGSCTGNAIAGAVAYQRQRECLAGITPSRLFIYYNERVVENTVNQDAGAQIRDGIKSVAQQGVCGEHMWPYDPAKFTTKPSDACYAAALKDKVTQYLRVQQSLSFLKATLAQGYAVVFGFSVYESFESDEIAVHGFMSMPEPHEAVVGGHAVLMAGYDDAQRAFLIRNSWGTDWGIAGYFWMPYEFAVNPQLADDFWAIQAVETE